MWDDPCIPAKITTLSRNPYTKQFLLRVGEIWYPKVVCGRGNRQHTKKGGFCIYSVISFHICWFRVENGMASVHFMLGSQKIIEYSWRMWGMGFWKTPNCLLLNLHTPSHVYMDVATVLCCPKLPGISGQSVSIEETSPLSTSSVTYSVFVFKYQNTHSWYSLDPCFNYFAYLTYSISYMPWTPTDARFQPRVMCVYFIIVMLYYCYYWYCKHIWLGKLKTNKSIQTTL